MREILFRGKAITSKKWIYGDLLQYADVAQIWEDTEQGKFNVLVIAETVGQYTGLTDKNGKKIFEGDILSTPKWKGVVAWGDGYGTYCVQHGINRPAIDIVMNEFDVEVIGNIYDNPELLK